MPTKVKLTVTFDGVTDVPKFAGQNPAEWSTGTPSSLSAYSLYYSGPEDKFIGTANLTGSQWRIKHLRMAGDDSKMIVQDLDAGEDRRIDFLELGYNSDVDFISTRVRYIFGWDGDKHDIVLGEEQVGDTSSINVYAAINNVTTGSGYVGSIETGGIDTVIIGSGGAGSVRTGGGDDTVKTGSAWVEHISTSSGNDMVEMGSGGGLVWLGSGDDTIKISEMGQDGGVSVNGSGGTDTLDFSPFTVGVTFDLGNHDWQDLSPASNGALGYVAQLGMENVVGGAKGDVLTGHGGDNSLKGLGGKDKLFGEDGNDKLDGGGGNDKLFGGNGKDNLIGGKGNDILEGGKGNDVLRGNAGADVFVFGVKSGTDKVKDFADGTDLLRIADHAGGLGSLVITDQGADLKIAHDGGVILLVGEAGTVLGAADFDFV